MNTSTKIKILAMESCVNSNLSSKDKLKYLKYLKESSPYVSIGYLLDGKFYKLNESEKKELKERFLKEQSKGELKRKEIMSRVGKSAGGLVGVAGIAKYLYKGGKIAPISFFLHLAITYSGGWVVWASYRWVRSWFDRCSEACGRLKVNDAERQICMKKCKEQYKKKIGELTKQGYKIKQSGKKLTKEESDKIRKKIKTSNK